MLYTEQMSTVLQVLQHLISYFVFLFTRILDKRFGNYCFFYKNNLRYICLNMKQHPLLVSVMQCGNLLAQYNLHIAQKMNTTWNMREYGFSLTHILPYSPVYTGECGSVKTRILAYFMQWKFPIKGFFSKEVVTGEINDSFMLILKALPGSPQIPKIERFARVFNSF